VLVGLAATLSPALLAWLGRRWTQANLLLAALVLQAIGIALPAVLSGVAAALIAAFLFGATFLGVATTALTIGTRLGFPRAVALLTAGYPAGQIVGPLVATPCCATATTTPCSWPRPSSSRQPRSEPAPGSPPSITSRYAFETPPSSLPAPARRGQPDHRRRNQR
jgi:MFS family permease